MQAQSSLSHFPFSFRNIIIAICLVLAFQAYLHLASNTAYTKSSLNTYAGEPLLTTPDGYFFMRYAREWQLNTYESTPELRLAPRPAHVPPLSIIAGAISSASNISLEKVAFYLTPILACTIFIITIWSGLALNSGVIPAIVCSAFTAVSPVWYARTRLGYFDTDSLNLSIFWLIALCLYKADTSSKKTYPVWMGAAALSTLLLHYWWPQAGLPFAGVWWGIYAASICIPSNKRARIFKLFLLACGALFVGWTLFGALDVIPSPLKEIMSSLRSHLALSAKTQSSMFTGTGSTIAELTPLTLSKLPARLAGHWIILCAIPFGIAAAWRKNALLAFYFTLPFLFFIAASVTIGNRFLMFAAPAFGFFCAAFFVGLIEFDISAKIKKLPASTTKVVAALFICLLIIPIRLDVNKKLRPTYNHNDALLATLIDRNASANAKVWNWWSPGYFLQYYAQRPTQIDGGLQAPERTFISALPLATSNPVLARNWIKLFSDKPYALRKITGYLHSKPKAVAFLKEALSNPQSVPTLVLRYNLPETINWQSWLFPNPEVYLSLYSDMLVKNTWLPIGLWNPKTQSSPSAPIISIPLQRVHVDQKQGIVAFSAKKYLPCSRMYYVTPSSLSHDRFKHNGFVSIFVQNSVEGFAIQEKYFDATAFKLLFVYPSKTPGFTLIKYNPFIGGVWRVD